MSRYDIAIVGAGIAGAGLAAAIGARARVLLIEAELHPGYHSTGRSAAFWEETYGGAAVQPLTTASFAALEDGGFLSARGSLHIADARGEAALDAFVAEFAGTGVVLEAVDRAGLAAIVPGLAPEWRRGVAQPSCRDIDVAALHAHYLATARRAGAALVCDAEVVGLTREGGAWRIATRAGEFAAEVLVNAAGAWASPIAALAGAQPIAITAHRRTVVQVASDPPADPALPLIMDALGRFYCKPEAGGRFWLSPHDETACEPCDAAPEELDVALAIDRFERLGPWRVRAKERAWAGLRSFAPDRAPVYGFDGQAPGFFWCAGQGGFGIQTAPAGSALAAALLLGDAPPPGLDPARYAPDRF